MPTQPTIESLRKSPKLLGDLVKFAGKEFSTENVTFYFANGNIEGLHNRYIKVGADKEINISSKTRSNMIAAYQAHTTGNPKAEAVWNTLLKTAKDEIALLCNDTISRWTCTIDYHKAQVATDIAKPLKLLGMEDKHKVALIEALAHFKAGKKSDGKKKLGDLLKKTAIKVEVDKVMENLKKAGMI